MAVAATVAAGAGAGTSPTVTLSATSDDSRGNVNVTTGTTPAAGALAVVSFGGSWTGYSANAGGGPFPTLTAQGTNAVGGVLGTLTAVISATFNTMTIYCTGTPAASTAYVITYVVSP